MTKFEAGMLPGRKSPCLWKLEDCTITPIAYFVSREAFDEWMAHDPCYTENPVGREAQA